MKQFKFYFLVLSIFVISKQLTFADPKIITLGDDNFAQFLPASAKSITNYREDGTIVCWYDERNNGSIYAQKISTEFSIVWQSKGVLLDDGIGFHFTAENDYPQIFSDGRGGALVIYTCMNEFNKEIHLQIVQRNGSVLPESICLSTEHPGENFSPAAVMNNENNIVIVWESLRDGNYDVHAQMIDLLGIKLWNNGKEILVCQNRFDQRKPSVAIDALNNVYVSWLDSRDSDGGDYYFQLYANVLDRLGNYTGLGSGGKLMFEDNLKKSVQETGTFGKLRITEESKRKELHGNHNMIWSGGQSVIASFERSNYEDDSYIKLAKLDYKLSKVWTKKIDAFYYQSGPSIVPDNQFGANVFWYDERRASNEIFHSSISGEGKENYGEPNGHPVSCDLIKTEFPRSMPHTRNQNGFCIYKNKIYFSWVNQRLRKLYLSNLYLTDESDNCSNVIELKDEISEGELTSITTCGNSLRVVFRETNKIFAMVMEINDSVSGTIINKPAINNFPNPFNPSTKISFSVPSDGFVRLSIFDIRGAEVKSLINEFKKSGSYSVDFNAADLPSGIYICKIDANGIFNSAKITLLK